MDDNISYLKKCNFELTFKNKQEVKIATNLKNLNIVCIVFAYHIAVFKLYDK